MIKQFQQLIFALFILLGSTSLKAQFTLLDIQYWIGNGTYSSILVIDFQDVNWDNSLIISSGSTITRSRFVKQ